MLLKRSTGKVFAKYGAGEQPRGRLLEDERLQACKVFVVPRNQIKLRLSSFDRTGTRKKPGAGIEMAGYQHTFHLCRFKVIPVSMAFYW
jgi:hypothetical protein